MGPCHQINLQRQFGGGEVYTASVARALEHLGRPSVLFAHPAANFWSRLLPAGTTVIPVSNYREIAHHLPASGATVLCHAAAPDAFQHLASHRLACFAHMPAYGRRTEGYRPFRLVLPVSQYVRQGLLAADIGNVYDEPLYGIVDLERGPVDDGPLRRGPLFDWDRRKIRDRLLGATESLWTPLVPQPEYRRPEDGALALAVVSRITTIKQFPLLFSHLAPILAATPGLRLDIFGSGGFASIRDLRRAVSPLGKRVRFWGQQRDVAKVYRSVDYVLTGLPELEALGLNVIEAQACGTPVLAMDAPPFTETMVDGVTGFLYPDPRHDGGAGFTALLKRILAEDRPNPRRATEHLVKFSAAAFCERLARALAALEMT
jgi:glycosyltransferase involved in cell wall biosynthesis